MQSNTPFTFMLPKHKDYTWIPEGFVLVTGPDNEMYIVPDFMVPSLDQDYRSEKKKKDLKATCAPGSVSTSFMLFEFNATVSWSSSPAQCKVR